MRAVHPFFVLLVSARHGHCCHTQADGQGRRRDSHRLPCGRSRLFLWRRRGGIHHRSIESQATGSMSASNGTSQIWVVHHGQPKVAVVQQSISSCSVRLRSSFREAPSGRTGAVGGEPFSAALLHVGRPMTHGPVGALALLHLLGMHTEHMCAARAARERRHRRQVPRSGVFCAAAVAVPIAVLQQHAQSRAAGAAWEPLAAGRRLLTLISVSRHAGVTAWANGKAYSSHRPACCRDCVHVLSTVPETPPIVSPESADSCMKK